MLRDGLGASAAATIATGAANALGYAIGLWSIPGAHERELAEGLARRGCRRCSSLRRSSGAAQAGSSPGAAAAAALRLAQA